MKHVLLITYAWPPDVSVGAIRPAKLAHHLGSQGWKPIVVTVRERYYSAVHPNSVDGTEAAILLRTRTLRNPSTWYGSIKAWLFSLVGRKEQFSKDLLAWTAGKTPSGSRESTLSFLKRLLLSVVQTPDEFQGWLPFAIVTAVRAVWSHRVECVISTGPPFSAHLVGLAVKVLTGVPWVAEFRDPWVHNNQKPARLKSRPADSLNRWMESRVMRAADRVVCVTHAMTKAYCSQYHGLHTSKWITITNGFDQEDFRGLSPVSRGPKFTISYVGNLAYARSPETLLEAVGEMFRDEELDRQEVAIRFIGTCRYAEGRSVTEMIGVHGLGNVVELLDTIPRQDALAEMMRSHVLLLLANEQEQQIPGKTYEYIAAGGHILALTGLGATADLISQIAGHAVCDITDLPGIKRVIRGWYDQFRRNGMTDWNRGAWDSAAIRKYEWRELGRVYASVLEECH